jgi:hypothetical protein
VKGAERIAAGKAKPNLTRDRHPELLSACRAQEENRASPPPFPFFRQKGAARPFGTLETLPLAAPLLTDVVDADIRMQGAG